MENKRKHYRKCGICGERHEQSKMIRTDNSPNGWICFDCYNMVLRYIMIGVNPHFQHERDGGLRVTHWMPIPELQCNFDYGIITYKHRFNMTRSLNDYEEITLNKCIRTGVQYKYKTAGCDKLIAEMQIVYRDENNKLQCLCLDLHDWTFSIKHVGDMMCNL